MENSSSLYSWIEAEFNDIDFGDLRLTKRFMDVTQGLASNSEKNISSSFDSWKDIKACYRFFSNDKVDASSILIPHRSKTLERVRNQKRVLFIQDTVVFSLGDRPGSNNLCLCSKDYSSKKPIRGLILHGLLALSDKGLPLGIINQEFIDRKGFKDKGRLTKTQFVLLPISQKESKRWPEFIKISKTLDTGDVQIIHIADREGDIYYFADKTNNKSVEPLIDNKGTENKNSLNKISSIHVLMDVKNYLPTVRLLFFLVEQKEQ